VTQCQHYRQTEWTINNISIAIPCLALCALSGKNTNLLNIESSSKVQAARQTICIRGDNIMRNKIKQDQWRTAYSKTGMLSFQSWKQPKLKPTASRPVLTTKLMHVTDTSAVNTAQQMNSATEHNTLWCKITFTHKDLFNCNLNTSHQTYNRSLLKDIDKNQSLPAEFHHEFIFSGVGTCRAWH